jgi:hypothetical protein
MAQLLEFPKDDASDDSADGGGSKTTASNNTVRFCRRPVASYGSERPVGPGVVFSTAIQRDARHFYMSSHFSSIVIARFILFEKKRWNEWRSQCRHGFDRTNIDRPPTIDIPFGRQARAGPARPCRFLCAAITRRDRRTPEERSP